jgi:small subunit ribosomal protein S10
MTTKKEKQKIRIKVKSYDHRLLDKSCKDIIDNVSVYSSDIAGPTPLPTNIKKYTINRSTFVHKKAREQFELRVHTRLIDILNPSLKVIETLKTIDLPAGVEIEVK